MKPFDNATNKVAEHAAELTAAGKLMSVAGGGDTVSALENAGVADKFSYISTAGGAFLEWMEGKELPGVVVLKNKQKRFLRENPPNGGFSFCNRKTTGRAGGFLFTHTENPGTESLWPQKIKCLCLNIIPRNYKNENNKGDKQT